MAAPRFFILIAYITMLFVYYLLATFAGNTLERFIRIFLNYTKMQMGVRPERHALTRIIFVSVSDSAGRLFERQGRLPGRRAETSPVPHRCERREW